MPSEKCHTLQAPCGISPSNGHSNFQNQNWEEQSLLRKSLKFTVTSHKSVHLNNATFYSKLAVSGECPFSLWQLSLLFLRNVIVLPWALAGHMIVWGKLKFQPKETELKVTGESFSLSFDLYNR